MKPFILRRVKSEVHLHAESISILHNACGLRMHANVKICWTTSQMHYSVSWADEALCLSCWPSVALGHSSNSLTDNDMPSRSWSSCLPKRRGLNFVPCPRNSRNSTALFSTNWSAPVMGKVCIWRRCCYKWSWLQYMWIIFSHVLLQNASWPMWWCSWGRCPTIRFFTGSIIPQKNSKLWAD